jgi:predicted GH43/DUF377 family glycosyl hydrolase
MLSVFRSPKNPFLSPTRANAFEALGTFNPSVVKIEDATHLFYRAMGEPDPLRTPGRGFSTVGYTVAHQDTMFGTRSQVIAPMEAWEAFGCEDPRATFFEGKWYVFYTALGGYPFGPDNIRAAVAIGDTPQTLTTRHLLTPFNAKAATLFPERVNGEAVMLITAHTDFTEDHPRPTIGIARSKNIEDFWSPEFWINWHEHLSENALPDVRRADSEHMEVAATPVLTDEGWLLIYSHIQDYYNEHSRIFGVEALLLDRDDPQKIIGKTEFPFLVPEESYERYGLVSNIVFPTGVVIEGDTLHLYYGAADTFCAEATLSLSDLISTMRPEMRASFMMRASDTPSMWPIPEHQWESQGVSNAAAVDLDGSVHLLYRATGPNNFSTMGYARFDDGIHMDERLPEPVYGPREEFENHGTEDPRLSRIDDTLYLTYTAFDGVHARGTLSTISVEDFLARRFDKWSPPQLLTPEGTDDKDVCVVPEMIDGKGMIFHRIDPTICADVFDTLPPTRIIDRCIEIMAPRPGMWDAMKVGAAGPPIRVEEGWLFIYHAVGNDHVYRLGAALLDEKTVTTVVSRTDAPIFEPVLSWEKNGLVNNVVFSCGIILRDDTLFVYYGGADTAIGVATLSKNELMRRLLPAL